MKIQSLTVCIGGLAIAFFWHHDVEAMMMVCTGLLMHAIGNIKYTTIINTTGSITVHKEDNERLNQVQ